MKKTLTPSLGKLSLTLAVGCLSISGFAQNQYSSSAVLSASQMKWNDPAGLFNALPNRRETSIIPLKDVSLASVIAIVVQGKVTDEAGLGLPGVTIQLKGTNTGVVTDMDGNYSMNVPDGQENGTLIFSFLGYQTQEIPINGRNAINIQMQVEAKSLEEVVVIGYQTVRKKDLTGATAVIDPEEATRVTAASVAEAIQGLSPGVTVRNTGAPGQGAAIEIRGVSSFTNANPLYVIDGMIADANPTINNNDIESIQILKDASAAAIYGSRAANGVVIITTKRGKEGPARVSLSAKYGLQQIPKRWDVMNNVEFAAMKRMQYENSGLTPPASVGDQFDPNINTDWQDVMIRLGTMQDYNLSLSGGSKSGNYLVSGSFFKNDGVLIGHSFERATLRINSQTRKGRVTFGENLLLSNSYNTGPAAGNPFYDMPQMLPIIPVQSEAYVDTINNNPEGWGTGTNEAITYAWNPVAVNDLFRLNTNIARAIGNAYADVNIFDWLTYRFNAGLDASFDFNKTIREQGRWGFNQAFEFSFVNEERARYLSVLLENTLNFNRTFGKHSINGVVGYSQQSANREFTLAGRNQLQSFEGSYMTTLGSATGTMTSNGGVGVDYRIYGILGRVNYSYADRYLLTLTGRNDWDSRFGADYRSGFFPSVALAWRISNEGFFSVPWVSDLKLHGSYGELGISTVASWDYRRFLNSNPRAIFGPNQTPFVGATQARLANEDLRWERRISRNVGVDASFFNNQFSLTFDVYSSLSKDVLVYLPVAWYLGNLGGDPAVNAASIRNSGIEAAATYRNYSGPFKWDISGNITTIKNKVLDVGNQGEGINYIQTGITRTQVGRSIGEWYVLQANGIFQSQEEIDSYTNAAGRVIQPFAKPGDIRYVDVNGDGQINQSDRTFVGSPWPKLQSGAQFNASYKNFSLNAQLIGVFGYKIFNGIRQVLDGYQNTNFRSDISPWSPANTDTDDPRIGVATNDPGLADNARLESSRWLENGSYVRMRNIEIGYTLPQSLLTRIAFQSARVYISGQNLFTITGYSGLDPDVTGQGIFERGFDAGNWPSSRVYSLGVQCEF
jgi:TonB-linked SusC/RagA family outer membrane protein